VRVQQTEIEFYDRLRIKREELFKINQMQLRKVVCLMAGDGCVNNAVFIAI